MRKKRDKITGEATYLVTNKCINSTAVLLEDGVKEAMRGILWKAAKFSCVEIRGFAIMDNCIHLVINVPERPGTRPGWKSMGRMIKHLYGRDTWLHILGYWRELADEEENGETDADRADAHKRLEEELNKYWARQYDLSQAVKTFKEMFNRFYKKSFPTVEGTLWNCRFKSQLLENNGEAVFRTLPLVEVSPVLATGKDPCAYKWCSTGRAQLPDGADERRAILETERLRNKSCGEKEALLRHTLFIRTLVNSTVQLSGSTQARLASATAVSRAKADLDVFLACQRR